MQVKQDHIGEIFCLYHTGEDIRITGVNEAHVKYETESGENYLTDKHILDMLPEQDPERKEAFQRNCLLGRTLLAAEASAMRAVVDGRPHDSESPLRVLHVAREQLNHFQERLSKERETRAPGKALSEAFLSELYEQGSGSHDTFFGCRVQNERQMAGLFSIDGKQMAYAEAVTFLAQAKFQRNLGLDQMIASAEKRHEQNESTSSREINQER